MKKIYLYGAGGHAKVIAEIAELLQYESIVFFEDNPKDRFLEYPVQAPPEDVSEHCVIAIGRNAVRKDIALATPRNFVSLIHPSTNISKRAKIGEGTVVMAGVSVNAESRIGKHCIINTNASVDHDCVIEDYVHISPNVALAGSVRIGEGSHIGIGACVIQGIQIGKWCTIGAGSVIIRDVPDGATVIGNPGRVIRVSKADL